MNKRQLKKLWIKEWPRIDAHFSLINDLHELAMIAKNGYIGEWYFSFSVLERTSVDWKRMKHVVHEDRGVTFY